MNNLEFKLNLLSNKTFEYFWRSPALFVDRIENRLEKKLGWKPLFRQPPQTQAFLWVRETKDFHTRTYIFNYWTEHYGLQHVPLTWQLRNAMGKLVAEGRLEPAPRQMMVIEAGSILRDHGISLPFQGSLLFSRATQGPGFGNEFKLLQEFYGDQFTTPIHEYGKVDNFNHHEYQTGVTIRNDEEVEDIELGFLNCNLSENLRRAPLDIELINHAGERMKTDGENMGPGESAYFSLNQLEPRWRSFIGKEPGNLSVHFPYSIGRPLVFHRYRGGISGCLNHLTGDKSRSPYIIQGKELERIGSGPVWVTNVMFDKDITTHVSLIMNWGFNVPFDIEGRLYDAEGHEIAKFTENLLPWKTYAIDLSHHVNVPDLAKPWRGSVRINAIPHPGLQFVPETFDANVEYVGKGWRAPINIGAGIVNFSDPVGVQPAQAGKKRTKNYLRVREDDHYETYLGAVNHSSHSFYNTWSDTTLRLISQDGRRETSTKVKIPPQGSFFQRVPSLFPDFHAVMGQSQVGTLHIRDTQVKLLGIHLLRHKQTGVFSADHYFGG